MLHPALAQALATARVEDQLRAADRWRTIARARRVARESRVAATSTAGQRSTSTPTHVHAVGIDRASSDPGISGEGLADGATPTAVAPTGAFSDPRPLGAQS